MTIAGACDAFLRDLVARNIRESTRASYKTMFKQLEAFAHDVGVESLEGIDRDAIRAWREQWNCAFSTQRKLLAQLRPFFSYAKEEGWISTSPLDGVRSPKSDARPTMPLSIDEMRALLEASNPKPKEQALLLLLRYSGLAIADAVTLARSSLHAGGELILRRSKSGELVTLQLPVEALASLEAIVQPARPYYFWTGNSATSTVAKYWRTRLKRVAATAGVEGFHPHRLRDTFAVELLLAGIAMQDVSTLLGHSSVQTTEQYYAPWNKARRNRLVSILKDAHRQDQLLLEFTPKKPAGAAGTAPAEASLATRVKPTRWVKDSI